MKENRMFWILLGIMITVATVAVGTTNSFLYLTAFDANRDRLIEIVKSQARLIESIERFNRKNRITSTFVDDRLTEATLSEIIDAHKQYQGIGKTGEFTLARKEDNQIVFILSHRHDDLEKPKPIRFDSKLAAPMRQALSGNAGTIVGPDYRGKVVLAAHEPVRNLNLGIVAKIDLSEIREPFVRAGLISGAFTLFLILTGTFFFLKFSNPIMQKLKENTASLKSLNDSLLEEIEKQKETEKILKQREALLNDVGEIAKIGGWEMDLVTRQSKWTQETFNIADIEMGQPIPNPEEHLDYYLPAYRQMISNAMQALVEKDRPLEFEAQLRTAKGSLKWCRALGRAEKKEGKCIRLYGTIQDITAHKQAEMVRKRNVARYRALFENMYDAVAIFKAINDGMDFVFVDINASGKSLSAVRKNEILDIPVTRVFPGIREMGLLDIFRRVYLTGKPEHLPTTRYQDDRITRWIESIVFKLPSGEIVAISHDNSAQHQAQEDLEKK